MFIIISYKISGRERVHSYELMALSRKDPLTGLPNRSAADEILNHEIARSQRSRQKVALFFLDLDNFKDINDTQGHAGGDALLQEVAHRLSTVLREQDVLTRLGGDEFFAIVPDANSETIETIARGHRRQGPRNHRGGADRLGHSTIVYPNQRRPFGNGVGQRWRRWLIGTQTAIQN